MRLLLVFVVVISACRTAPVGHTSVAEQRLAAVDTFHIELVFRGLEGLKRVPYRYTQLRMQMDRQLHAQPPTYVFRISCTGQELQGILEKLALDEDVISVREYE
jgi:hypothetical protein